MYSLIPFIIALVVIIIKGPNLQKSTAYVSIAAVVAMIGVLANDPERFTQIISFRAFALFIFACPLISLALSFGKKNWYYILLMLINIVAMIILGLLILMPAT